jgi:hypothetical protein
MILISGHSCSSCNHVQKKIWEKAYHFPAKKELTPATSQDKIRKATMGPCNDFQTSQQWPKGK